MWYHYGANIFFNDQVGSPAACSEKTLIIDSELGLISSLHFIVVVVVVFFSYMLPAFSKMIKLPRPIIGLVPINKSNVTNNQLVIMFLFFYN
jgi:hypothetical protein